jgi:hypothetical protein
MRLSALLTLLSLTALPGLALAQTTMAPSAPPGSGMASPSHGQKWSHKGSWKRHHGWPGQILVKFYTANTTHDGHLTLAQAKTGNLKMVVDHFAEIDTKHRGYVTFYDIQAWGLDNMAKRLEHRADQLRAQD